MRISVIALLALLAGPALAEDLCTFTFNTVSRRVEPRCTGLLRDAPLAAKERLLLSSGRAKVCVVRLERNDRKQLRMSDPECT